MASDQSHPSELAHLIRSRRIVQGMSQARLGAAVDRTATTVRRWERGESLPADDALDALAGALEIPRPQLDAAIAAAAMDGVVLDEADAAPTPSKPPPLAEAPGEQPVLAGLAPHAAPPRVPAPAPPAVDADVVPLPVTAGTGAARAAAEPSETEPASETEPGGEDDPQDSDPAREPESDAALVAAPVVAPVALVHAAEPGAAAANVLDVGDDAEAAVASQSASVGAEALPWIELPTETILAPLEETPAGDEGVPEGGPTGVTADEVAAPVPSPRRAAAATAAPDSAQAAPQVVLIDKSYIEDRWQRILYGLRAVLTVVALGVMAVILAWAVLELWDAIGAVLDLFGEADETPTDGTVESLRSLGR